VTEMQEAVNFLMT